MTRLGAVGIGKGAYLLFRQIQVESAVGLAVLVDDNDPVAHAGHAQVGVVGPVLGCGDQPPEICAKTGAVFTDTFVGPALHRGNQPAETGAHAGGPSVAPRAGIACFADLDPLFASPRGMESCDGERDIRFARVGLLLAGFFGNVDAKSWPSRQGVVENMERKIGRHATVGKPGSLESWRLVHAARRQPTVLVVDGP